MTTQQTEEQGDEDTKSCKPPKIEVMRTLGKVAGIRRRTHMVNPIAEALPVAFLVGTHCAR